MWEATIICKSCDKTHLVCAEIKPRAFGFECPETSTLVDMPFRDPSLLADPWSEVEGPSPQAVRAISAEEQGRFEV
jgi:hypothetical protein